MVIDVVYPSSTKGKDYHVKVYPGTGEVICECEGFKFRESCRHSVAVKEMYWPTKLLEFVRKLSEVSVDYGYVLDGDITISTLMDGKRPLYVYDRRSMFREATPVSVSLVPMREGETASGA